MPLVFPGADSLSKHLWSYLSSFINNKLNSSYIWNSQSLGSGQEHFHIIEVVSCSEFHSNAIRVFCTHGIIHGPCSFWTLRYRFSSFKDFLDLRPEWSSSKDIVFLIWNISAKFSCFFKNDIVLKTRGLSYGGFCKEGKIIFTPLACLVDLSQLWRWELVSFHFKEKRGCLTGANAWREQSLF